MAPKGFPAEILKHLRANVFAVTYHWTKVVCSSIADEVYEMCINKELKAAVIHRTTSYLPFLIIVLRLTKTSFIIILEKDRKQYTSNTITDSTS